MTLIASAVVALLAGAVSIAAIFAGAPTVAAVALLVDSLAFVVFCNEWAKQRRAERWR